MKKIKMKIPTESELEAWKEHQGIIADFQAIQYQSGEYALTIGYVDGVSRGIYLENGKFLPKVPV